MEMGNIKILKTGARSCWYAIIGTRFYSEALDRKKARYASQSPIPKNVPSVC
jgi:hypothetical protein